MGQIASDFFQDYGLTDEMENPFSAAELIRMASYEKQKEFSALMDSDDESGSFIPGDVLPALLRDRAFFAAILSMRDFGEQVILSGVSLGVTTAHISQMGFSPEIAAENIVHFYECEEHVRHTVSSAMIGNRGRVSRMYVFANGWLGVETEEPVDVSWMEDIREEGNASEYPPAEDVFKPSISYLFSDDGELIATPDIQDNIDAWMDFVDLFSAVHEEASAVEDTAAADTGMDEAGKSYIVFSEEVQDAMEQGKPVVVIESAATFGGMIYPGIYEFACSMRNTIRDNGAVPAFAAIIGGRIHIGLTDEEICYLEDKRGTIFKASARDVPILLAKRADGVMTIAAAVQVAAMVGLTVACGSGIGGAQIGAEKTMDISTDLESVANNAVMVVCSGTKPILNLDLTMEYLETKGVPVIGYGTDRMPEYMVRGSGFRLTYRMDTPGELAEVMQIKAKMGIPGGVLVVNPVPKEHELDPVRTHRAVEDAMKDVEKNHVMGKAITGYMMGRIREYLGRESVESQKAFLLNNAVLAAKIAAALRSR